MTEGEVDTIPVEVDYWGQFQELREKLRALKGSLTEDYSRHSQERFAQKRIKEVRLDRERIKEWYRHELERIRDFQITAEAMPQPAKARTLARLAERFQKVETLTEQKLKELNHELSYWEEYLALSPEMTFRPLNPPQVSAPERADQVPEDNTVEEPSMSEEEAISILSALDEKLKAAME